MQICLNIDSPRTASHPTIRKLKAHCPNSHSAEKSPSRQSPTLQVIRAHKTKLTEFSRNQIPLTAPDQQSTFQSE